MLGVEAPDIAQGSHVIGDLRRGPALQLDVGLTRIVPDRQLHALLDVAPDKGPIIESLTLILQLLDNINDSHAAVVLGCHGKIL